MAPRATPIATTPKVATTRTNADSSGGRSRRRGSIVGWDAPVLTSAPPVERVNFSSAFSVGEGIVFQTYPLTDRAYSFATRI